MTRTITLPIRCSTVKKVDSLLTSVVTWELFVACVTGFVWSVTQWVYILYNRYSIFNETLTTYATDLEVILLVIAALCFFVSPIVIISFYDEYIPEIKCIKDEVG